MAQFVAQNSDNLFWFTLLHQGVVDDNVLLPGETKEVSIAVGASLATVNRVNVVQREVKVRSKLLNASFDGARLERRQFVEHRQDNDWVDSNGKHLHHNAEQPEIVEELVSSLLNNLQECSQERTAERNSKSLTFQHIRNPKLERLLVETKLLLKDKSVVVRQRQRQNGSQQVESEEEHKSVSDFALEP